LRRKPYAAVKRLKQRNLKLRAARVFTDLAWVASDIESDGPNVKVGASDYGDS